VRVNPSKQVGVGLFGATLSTASQSETAERMRTMAEDRFTQLYMRYGPTIYGRCRRLLNDPAAAEDAAQETFLRVYRHLESAPSSDEALRWIYRIATNYCLNELRDRKRDAEPIADFSHVADSGDDEDRMADRDLARRLSSRAPAPISVASWLYHVDGLDQAEVALVLGVSRRTVVNHLAAFKRYVKKFVSRSAA
jgi:RNA polymerase sigma-70 factor (ECF subfamily)